MKKSIAAGIFIAVFCLGVIACDQFKAQPAKWEYQVLSFDSTNSTSSPQDQLNKLGKAGWELVSVQSWEVNGNTQAFFGKACLKRPLAQ
jgi:Domain of unknown function (DUF4177)